jgi:hypothetical protein
MDLSKLLKSQWDRVGAWLLVLAGALALIFGWVGVSGKAYLANQLPYVISGGIGGLFLLGVAATLWLSADLRDEWQKLDRIEQVLSDLPIESIFDSVTTETEREAPEPARRAPRAGRSKSVEHSDVETTAMIPPLDVSTGAGPTS